MTEELLQKNQADAYQPFSSKHESDSLLYGKAPDQARWGRWGWAQCKWTVLGLLSQNRSTGALETHFWRVLRSPGVRKLRVCNPCHKLALSHCTPGREYQPPLLAPSQKQDGIHVIFFSYSIDLALRALHMWLVSGYALPSAYPLPFILIKPLRQISGFQLKSSYNISHLSLLQSSGSSLRFYFWHLNRRRKEYLARGNSTAQVITWPGSVMIPIWLGAGVCSDLPSSFLVFLLLLNVSGLLEFCFEKNWNYKNIQGSNFKWNLTSKSKMFHPNWNFLSSFLPCIFFLIAAWFPIDFIFSSGSQNS